MKSLLKIALAATALALAAPAFAADMATKAAPIAPGYPYAASGFYFGVGASSSAGTSTVANTGVFAAGAGVDVDVGYQFKGGLDYIATEFDATYTNLGAAALCNTGTGATSCSATNQWELEPLVKFGFPIQTVLSALPNLSTIFPALPSLPASFSATNVHPYVYAGMPIRNMQVGLGGSSGQEWIIQGEIGLGALAQLSNGLVADTRAGCSLGTEGIALNGSSGAHSAEVNTICTAKVDFLY